MDGILISGPLLHIKLSLLFVVGGGYRVLFWLWVLVAHCLTVNKELFILHALVQQNVSCTFPKQE